VKATLAQKARLLTGTFPDSDVRSGVLLSPNSEELQTVGSD
jgi:hypothetical protein